MTLDRLRWSAMETPRGGGIHPRSRSPTPLTNDPGLATRDAGRQLRTAQIRHFEELVVFTPVLANHE